MGGVFLRRRRRAFSEVINDLNGDIVNLFRVMRHHPGELIRQFEWPLYAPPGIRAAGKRPARYAHRHPARRAVRRDPEYELQRPRCTHFKTMGCDRGAYGV